MNVSTQPYSSYYTLSFSERFIANLFRIIPEVESHVLITGATGTGKTLLIKFALLYGYKYSTIPEDTRVIIFDTVSGQGSFKNFVNHYLVPSLNIFDYVPHEHVEPLLGYVFENFMNSPFTAIQREVFNIAIDSVDKRNFINITYALKSLREKLTGKFDYENACLAVVRRLDTAGLSHGFFNFTDPLIDTVIRNVLDSQVVGIDLRHTTLKHVSDIARYVWITFFLKAMLFNDEYLTSGRFRKTVIIIDEAHNFFRSSIRVSEGLSENPLASFIREGRNYNVFFILITQSLRDISEDVQEAVRFKIRFLSDAEKSARELMNYGRYLQTHHSVDKTYHLIQSIEDMYMLDMDECAIWIGVPRTRQGKVLKEVKSHVVANNVFKIKVPSEDLLDKLLNEFYDWQYQRCKFKRFDWEKYFIDYIKFRKIDDKFMNEFKRYGFVIPKTLSSSPTLEVLKRMIDAYLYYVKKIIKFELKEGVEKGEEERSQD